MKPIVFVAPFPKDAAGINEVTVSQPLGIASIAALLEERGVRCHIIDANILRLDNDAVIKKIGQIRPGIVGISINVVTTASGLELTRKIKELDDGIVVILGGPQATVAGEDGLFLADADAVVFGEGEMTMLEIAQRYSKASPELFKGVRGVIYKDQLGIVKNSPRERIQDLDSLPHPAYHLLPDLNIYLSRARAKPAASVITSRGCPFQCIYCNKSVFGSQVTMFSAVKILDLLDLLINKFKVRQIDIYDDNFTLDKQRANELFDDIIERKYNLLINLQTGVRGDSMDSELINKMKRAGVFKIGFGVESGSPSVLKIAKKQLNLERVLEATRLAKEAGIMTYGFFILGLPGENAATLQQTIDFAKKMNPDVANFSIAMPFPGTELYEMVKEKGRFLIETRKDALSGFYGARAFFEYGGLEARTLLKYYKRAYYSFYFRPKKIFDTITGIKSWEEFRWVLYAAFNLISVTLSSVFRGGSK